jgi:prephenate dehydrogenase
VTDETGGSGFARVGIVGLGLMGGSLARSLKQLGTPPWVRGLSLEEEDRQAALTGGAVDECPETIPGFLAELDLVVYCTPLKATLSLMESHRGSLPAEALVTDVVSLKAPILRKAEGLGLKRSFVGSHPMAGGEGTGFRASRSGLFDGAKVWLVPGGADPEAVDRIEGFWASLGAEAVRVEAAVHDQTMAWVSHLPQITANALAKTLAGVGIPSAELGPGGRDMTRLAGSGPEMWIDLLTHAPPALLTGLEAMEEALEELRRMVREERFGEIAETMRRTREWREGRSWS